MAKHVFLTGEIQIGKSTALRRFLENTGFSADGFMSHIVNAEVGRELYLARFDSILGESDSRLCARVNFSNTEVLSDVFDTHGAKIVASSGKRTLIVMDELGRMEQNSPRFIAAVMAKLDADTRVVGVVKKADCEFLDAVRARTDIELITVTKENRDTVPPMLTTIFKDLAR